MQRGILTDTFLKGIPADKAESIKEFGITEQKVAKAKLLNEIALHRGQTLSQMAIAWILRDGKVTSALCGASLPEHVESNMAALNKLDFTTNELVKINTILSSD